MGIDDYNSDSNSDSEYESSDSEMEDYENSSPRGSYSPPNSYSDDDMVEPYSDEVMNVVDALSTQERDYLVRNNGDRIKVTSLVGKTILLFRLILPMKPGDEADLSQELIEAYDNFYRRGDFEVVMVAKMEGGKLATQADFDECFSGLPWLAIPFDDSKSRARLWKLLDYFYAIHVVHPNGNLFSLQSDDLLMYGLETCYPFTEQRMQEIHEYMAKRRDIDNISSLETLLATPNRDFVVSLHDERHKVLISDLKTKLVGIYLFATKYHSKKLKRVYRKCRAQGLEIEIVLAYADFRSTQEDYDECIRNEFKGMPWLALPFCDKRSRRCLFEILMGDFYERFAVVGPNGSFVDLYAGDVVSSYGVAAYPFTREKAMHNEMARLMELRLESLLVYNGRDYVVSKDGVRCPVSSLRGRTVVLFFSDELRKLFRRLIKWYDQLKAIDDGFEVIYVGFNRDEASFKESLALMPWLALPHDIDHSDFLYHQTLNGHFWDTLLGFGSDGRLLTMYAQDYLKEYGTDAYPFTDCDLFEEVQWSLSEKHDWHYFRREIVEDE